MDEKLQAELNKLKVLFDQLEEATINFDQLTRAERVAASNLAAAVRAEIQIVSTLAFKDKENWKQVLEFVRPLQYKAITVRQFYRALVMTAETLSK